MYMDLVLKITKHRILWGWHCGVVGRATACYAGVPYGHLFRSRLLHF